VSLAAVKAYHDGKTLGRPLQKSTVAEAMVDNSSGTDEEDEFASLDEDLHLGQDVDDEWPLDLHDALAQVEDEPEVPTWSLPEGSGGGLLDHTLLPHETFPEFIPAEPSEPSLLPCENWLAKGGVHDMESPLVRVSNDDLQEAALRGDAGLVRRLVQASASVNAPIRGECDDEYMSLLHVLALKPAMPNTGSIITEVINGGANLNVRSTFGSTPLCFACLSKHSVAVRLLLEAQADPSPIDDHGRKAIACAILPIPDVASVVMSRSSNLAETKALEIIQLLAQFGVNLNDGGHVSPLEQAVMQTNLAVVIQLLDAAVDPNALHVAVEFSSPAIVRELIDAEANPFTKDQNGKTALRLAEARGETEINEMMAIFISELHRIEHPHLRELDEEHSSDVLTSRSTSVVQNDSCTSGTDHASVVTGQG